MNFSLLISWPRDCTYFTLMWYILWFCDLYTYYCPPLLVCLYCCQGELSWSGKFLKCHGESVADDRHAWLHMGNCTMECGMPFEVLGLYSTASLDTIKCAYQTRVMIQMRKRFSNALIMHTTSCWISCLEMTIVNNVITMIKITTAHPPCLTFQIHCKRTVNPLPSI